MKLERVKRTEFGIPFLERPEIHQQRDALHHRNREMIVALRADLVIPLDLLAIHDLPAMVTLQPHALRNLRSLRSLGLRAFLLLKPRHRLLLSRIGRPRVPEIYDTGRATCPCKCAEYHSTSHDARRFPMKDRRVRIRKPAHP